ncbi:MAG: BolA family protein [Gammaproteobacteria bacterium]
MTANELRDLISTHVKITDIDVIDQSAAHAGHSSNKGGGYFDVHVVSPDFQGLSRVARHQKIYTLVSGKIGGEIHALSIIALTPEEAK